MAFHGVDGNLIRTRLEEAKKGEGTGERSDCLRLDPLWSLTEAKTRHGEHDDGAVVAVLV